MVYKITAIKTSKNNDSVQGITRLKYTDGLNETEASRSEIVDMIQKSRADFVIDIQGREQVIKAKKHPIRIYLAPETEEDILSLPRF